MSQKPCRLATTMAAEKMYVRAEGKRRVARRSSGSVGPQTRQVMNLYLSGATCALSVVTLVRASAGSDCLTESIPEEEREEFVP